MRRKRNKAASPHLPVLMVRGFGEAAPLPHIVGWYERQGFVFETMPFSVVNSTDVVRHARDVKRHAEALAARHGGRINLVGYSLGGVVGLYALNRLGLHHIVARFVAYGSPFQGTQIARLADFVPPMSKLGRQMKPGSRFLAELLADRTADQVPTLSMAGTRDLVVPAATSVLPRAQNLLVRHSHSDFMFDYDVHRTICSFLE